jgi:hypothetical protein
VTGNGRSDPTGFPGRFLCNLPRKVALFAGLAALLALMIGAGFANMSASGAATPLETAVVRWVMVGCLVTAFVAYIIGGRMLRDEGGS